jgi:hypothetical protein
MGCLCVSRANNVYILLLVTATAGTHTGAAAVGLWHCQVCVRCKGCKWGCISQRCKLIKPKMVILSHDESSDDLDVMFVVSIAILSE